MNRPLIPSLEQSGFTARNVDLLVEKIYRDINEINQVAVAAGGTTGSSVEQLVSGDTVSLSSGSNVIAFPTPLSTSTYRLLLRAHNSSNNVLTVEVSNKSNTSFTLLAPEDGTLEYEVFARV